ncbi:hypothetical protein [Streptomyces sp. NPDC058671]|uniref:hypothetical protein n=1 Tax=Streptomyces sp. NPDC058671 TaxID=3346590 RepID=UPI00366758DC
MIAFLKEHSTILLALLTVAAAFGGTWLGSHIQAKGGLAQAKAAKEAAETAAAATLQAVREQSDRAAAAAHAAAVRDRRTAAIADLLRATRECVRALDRQYREPGNDATMNTLHEAFIHARGTVELCAPTSLLPAVKELAKTTRHLSDFAHERAESNRAMTHLQTLERDGVAPRPFTAPSQRWRPSAPPPSRTFPTPWSCMTWRRKRCARSPSCPSESRSSSWSTATTNPSAPRWPATGTSTTRR